MEELKKKRTRNPNWDDLEKNLLRTCIKDKIDIIENKCTDTNTNNNKKIAWQEVSESFNDLNVKERTLTEIRQQWRALKIDAKKSYSFFNKTLKETGGAEPPPSLDQNTIDILALLPLEFADVNQCDYDNDNITCTPKQSAPAKRSVQKDVMDPGFEEKVGKKRKINEELKATSESRKERDMAIVTFLQEEHDLKMEHMVRGDARAHEEHVLRMKSLKLLNELLEKQLSKL